MYNGEQTNMQATADLDMARSWARRLEDGEALRSGVAVLQARQTIARRTGIAPGTLETLRAGRLKTVAVHIFRRLHSAVVAEMEAEIGRLEHELVLVRQAGLDPRSDEVLEVEAHLSRARAALGKG